MAKQDAKDDLSIKVSHADMLAYTDQIYTDIADPAINGINTHAADESPHNLPARFAAVQSQIDDINDELATKLGTGDISLDGKADVIGDTFTGTVVFAGGDEKVVLQGPEQTDRSIIAKTGTSNRWELGVASNDDEQGSNSGSNFVVARFADNGNFLGIPFAIDRQTGVTYIDQLSVGGGDILVGEGVDVRVQNTEPVDNLKIGTVWVRPCGTTGGGAVGVLPSYGLISHIAADSLTLNNGDSVISIDDQSSANNPAAAVSTVKYYSAMTPSGAPAVKGGYDGYLTLPTNMWTGKVNGHMFMYVLVVGGGTVTGPWNHGNGNLVPTAKLSDPNIVEDSAFCSGSGATYFTASPPLKSCWRIYEVSSDNVNAKTYIDGVYQTAAARPFGVSSTPPRLLRSTGGTVNGIVYMADFIAYDRVLTSQEAADVRAYLVSKNGPTGPLSATPDPQYAAVMALNPDFYLPLTSDYNDYSGNNNHAVYTRGAPSIGLVPSITQGPSYTGHVEGGTTYNNYWVEAPMPTLSFDMSVSWWATRGVHNSANWSMFSHDIGTTGAWTFTQEPDRLSSYWGASNAGPWMGANSSRTIMDHYAITVENGSGYPIRWYINGNLVYTDSGNVANGEVSGMVKLFKKGVGDVVGPQYGSHFALWNRTLSEAEVQGLTAAKVAW